MTFRKRNGALKISNNLHVKGQTLSSFHHQQNVFTYSSAAVFVPPAFLLWTVSSWYAIIRYLGIHVCICFAGVQSAQGHLSLFTCKSNRYTIPSTRCAPAALFFRTKAGEMDSEWFLFPNVTH